LRPERKRSARYIYVHIIVARRQGHHHLRHYRVNSTPHRCHPYLPVTPNEIVDSAFEAAEAGAAILHLHARDPETGRPDQRADAFAPFLSCIKQGTDAVVNLTSGGSPFMKIEERIQPSVRFKPEPASFNMGSMNFGLFPQLNRFKEFKHDWERQYLESTRDLVFRNTFRDECAVTALSANGTRFEFECYDVGHLYNLAHFAERGLIKPPFLVQTVFGILGGIGTHSEDVMHMRRTADRLFGAITAGPYLGAGRMQMPIAAMAAAMSAHVRVGLEDSLWIGKGQLARSNGEQVRRVRSIVEGLGLTPATPDEARRRCRCEEHPAGAHEGNVPGGKSAQPLSRLPQPAAQRRDMGDRDQGLRTHRGSCPARLGRARLGAAVRARA
jgi:uncharacterized protein (DUF849 family)